MRRVGQTDRPTAIQVRRSLSRLPNQPCIGLISLYRRFISPLLPSVCRFQPSCSQYSLQAFRKYNFFKALGLSAWRVLRCNPFCKGGHDPLP
ncbi:MAG: membrane protein insertion efficiency factor YidD [Candidatus Cloacimonetes bacterium]|nr:membrane protein insertion efficiency factor YidD [Candidatus Cloacimonadota bacterium]